MNYIQIITVALLIEAMWETLKMIWQDGKLSIDKIGSIALGIIVCLLVNLDLFVVAGFEITIPLVGNILTGILASRGSNFIHDIYTKIQAKG